MAPGRTWRTRRKSKPKSLASKSFLEHVSSQDISLFQWAKHSGLKLKEFHIKPFNFEETGRGLLATRNLQQNMAIIRVPENLLLHTSVVINGYIGDVIRRHQLKGLTHVEILCTYLVCERYSSETSPWAAYIKSLPLTYSTPSYWDNCHIESLPPWISFKALKHIKDLETSFDLATPLLQILIKYHHRLIDVLLFENYKWAWNTINTRAVYMKHNLQNKLFNSCEDNVALAPVLDFLNHSCNVEVKAGFNHTNKCYEIKTLQNFQKGDQVFINYGPHDNIKLLVEYGFVVPNNPHDAVPIELDEVCTLADEMLVTQKEIKLKIIKNECLLNKNSSCSKDGLSWNVHIALVILSLPIVKMHLWQQYRIGKDLTIEEKFLYYKYVKYLLTKKLKLVQEIAYNPEIEGYHKRLVYEICKNQRGILEFCIGSIT